MDLSHKIHGVHMKVCLVFLDKLLENVNNVFELFDWGDYRCKFLRLFSYILDVVNMFKFHVRNTELTSLLLILIVRLFLTM